MRPFPMIYIECTDVILVVLAHYTRFKILAFLPFFKVFSTEIRKTPKNKKIFQNTQAPA